MTLNIKVLPYPPYSPGFAPSGYHLFKSLEEQFTNITNCEGVKTDIDFFHPNLNNFTLEQFAR